MSKKEIDYQICNHNTTPDVLSANNHDAQQSCGWRKCKPKKLQKLNSPKWFLFFLAVFSIVQGMIINGFTNVGLSTLEKQFKLSSQQSGMIVAAKEISSLLLIAFLSFYGSFGHKPKYLGYGALLTSFGSLLYVLPHSLIGKHIPDQYSGMIKNHEVCSVLSSFNETVAEARCELLGSSEWFYLLIFVAAKLLIGAGTAPLFTLGAAYIDENVKPKVSPIYLGIWYVCTSFGPGIGFVAGGSLLNVYVDLIQPPGIELKPEDPQWIGAWWIGHFCGGLLILLSSCALLAYPRSMPGSEQIRLQAIQEGTIQPADVRLEGKLSDMIPATFTLLKNPVFVFNTLALSAGTIISTGLGPFVVKYLQAQFGVSTMKAGVASGITLIPGTAGGIFVGSYLMRRLKGRDTCETASKYCFYFQLIAVLSVASFLIPGCISPTVAGVNRHYYNETDEVTFNLSSTCNSNCVCKGVSFNPVCGIDNITYFSPCHLGCFKKLAKSEYGECSCISPTLVNEHAHHLNWSTKLLENMKTPTAAVIGSCDRDCKNLIPFLCGIVVLLVLNFVNAVPTKMVVMRCVPDNERAYALGVQWIILTLLGSMPGPVLFGVFIDRTCELWETTCHGKGNCLFYDNETLSFRLAAAIFLFQVLAALCYFISWKSVKPPKVTFKKDLTSEFDDPYISPSEFTDPYVSHCSTLTSISERTLTSTLDESTLESTSMCSAGSRYLTMNRDNKAIEGNPSKPSVRYSYESSL